MNANILNLIFDADDLLFRMLENGYYSQSLQAGILEHVENVHNILDMVGV
jgi:hypothetical protein